MLRAFLFYCSQRRQTFFFHKLSDWLTTSFSLLTHSKEAFSSQKKTLQKRDEESHFFRFPPLRLISLFSATITSFPRGLHYVHRTAGTFLGKGLDYCTVLSLAQGKGTLCGVQAQNGNGFVAKSFPSFRA